MDEVPPVAGPGPREAQVGTLLATEAPIGKVTEKNPVSVVLSCLNHSLFSPVQHFPEGVFIWGVSSNMG